MTKKLFYGLLATFCICLSGSLYGMKRTNSALSTENQEQESVHLPSELCTKIAGYSLPKEKNKLMRLNKQYRACLKDRTAILRENPSTVSWRDKDEAMIQYAGLGNIKMMQFLVANGVDVNCQNILGISPFHVAAENSQKEAMQLLIDNDVNVNYLKPPMSSLHEAVYKGDIEVVKLLLASPKIDLNIPLANGATALYIASCKDYTEIVKLLLDKGADVDCATNNGFTPLMIASVHGHIEIVKLLLDKGANVGHVNHDEDTALGAAVAHNRTDIVELLFGYATEYDKRYAFFDAVDLHDRDMVALLLKKGVDIDCTDSQGWTPLHHASCRNNIGAVKLLFDYGADVNCVTKSAEEMSALLLAVEYCDTEIVELLVEKGADVNHVNSDGWNALSIAAYYDHSNVVSLLLAKGVNIHQQITADFKTEVTEGDTPLQIAQKMGRTKIVGLIEKYLQRDASEKKEAVDVLFNLNNEK